VQTWHQQSDPVDSFGAELLIGASLLGGGFGLGALTVWLLM